MTLSRSRIALFLVTAFLFASTLRAADFHGYAAQDLEIAGQKVRVIAPRQAAAGKPWIWNARFLGHRPDVDLALLGLGFHVVFMDDKNEMLGSPECVALWARVHDHLTRELGLSKKCALEGLSRGGLYVYNFAAAHPDKVAVIYADAPVCDFRSWPAGKKIFPEFSGPGGGGSWTMMKKSYGFNSDDDAKAWTKHPADNLKVLADSNIPLIHVIGDADDVVPVSENTAVIEKRYKKLGGTIVVYSKPGEKHAHGLADPTPVVDFIVAATCGKENVRPILAGVRRILFLGDSITHGGRYIEYVASYLATRHPDRSFEILNVGLSSETTSGLSEEGHAGGKFPRPDLHERLDRALAAAKPDLVFACYGINDGIYMPLSEQRLAAYQKGVTTLADKVKAAGARFIVLTPPVFDSLPILKRTTPDGVGGPFVDYDKVMTHYSQWLLGQREKGWTVGDIHGPMLAYVQARRAKEPAFTFSKDGVHPGPAGHWMMATPILEIIGALPEVDIAQVELGTPRVGQGNVKQIKVSPTEVSFLWTTKIPMPMDPEWDADFVAAQKIPQRFNQHRLSVSGLPAGKWDLYEGEQLLGSFTKEDLQRGLDIGTLDKCSLNQKARDLRKPLAEKLKVIGDAWRSQIGHKRPGVGAGLPMDQATARAALLDEKIKSLCVPQAIEIKLRKAQ